MYFAGHILKASERESSEGDSSGDAVAKTGQKVLRSDSPTFKLPAGSLTIFMNLKIRYFLFYFVRVQALSCCWLRNSRLQVLLLMLNDFGVNCETYHWVDFSILQSQHCILF